MSDLPNATAVHNKAMTFDLNFDVACVLITIVAIGDANKDSRLESLRAVRMDPRFRDDYRILCKFLDKKHIPDSAECRHLGLTVAAFFRGQKIALVVSKSELPKLKDGIAVVTDLPSGSMIVCAMAAAIRCNTQGGQKEEEK